jgi:hypothetical protein
MEEIMAAYPELSDFGFGVFDPRRKTPEQRSAELAKDRLDLLHDRSLDGFASEKLALQVSENQSDEPGGLQHVAGDEIGYTTNGVFIAAAIAEGFRVQREGPNALFNMSTKPGEQPNGRTKPVPTSQEKREAQNAAEKATRRVLAAFAFDLLRAGVSGRETFRKMLDHNEDLPEPLPLLSVARLSSWRLKKIWRESPVNSRRSLHQRISLMIRPQN